MEKIFGRTCTDYIFLKNSYNSIIRQANLKVGKRFKQLPLERRHINDQWKMAEENIWRRQKYSLS